MASIPKIKAIRQHSVADEGSTVVFEVEQIDGERVLFGADVSLLSSIVTSFAQLGAEAEKYRQSRGILQTGIEAVVPYRLRGAQAGMGQDGSVVLRIQTNLGFPIQVAIPADQVHGLVTTLQKGAQTPPPVPM
jgi:hypothetical protein